MLRSTTVSTTFLRSVRGCAVRVKGMIRNEVPYHGYIENCVEVAERKGILILKKADGRDLCHSPLWVRTPGNFQ